MEWSSSFYYLKPLLTDADRDVGGPLVVVLAGNGLLSNQFKAELTLKAQYISIRETISFPHPVERCARVATALLVNFYREWINHPSPVQFYCICGALLTIDIVTRQSLNCTQTEGKSNNEFRCVYYLWSTLSVHHIKMSLTHIRFCLF